ncbi:MAG: hypothetical protein C5S48_00005 [Candidatus Methanogaster sp.]|nr:MAG: hypothetical protein C5S48_00005 [ANME-2 cluster archaeon]
MKRGCRNNQIVQLIVWFPVFKGSYNNPDTIEFSELRSCNSRQITSYIETVHSKTG